MLTLRFKYFNNTIPSSRCVCFRTYLECYGILFIALQENPRNLCDCAMQLYLLLENCCNQWKQKPRSPLLPQICSAKKLSWRQRNLLFSTHKHGTNGERDTSWTLTTFSHPSPTLLRQQSAKNVTEVISNGKHRSAPQILTKMFPCNSDRGKKI